MWLFATVLFAIATPPVRSALETLFAELTIVFFDWLPAFSVCIACIFVALVAYDVQNKSGGSTTQSNQRSSSTLAWWQTALLTSSLLTAGGALTTAQDLAGLADAQSAGSVSVVDNTNIPDTSMDNLTSLGLAIRHATNCTYSNEATCIRNVTEYDFFGKWRRGKGYCTSMESAFVNVTGSGAALPNQYNPMSGKEAYEKGYTNRFSEWTESNQKQFHVDCPLLYNETIAEGSDYLCCTENQYASLSTQVRMIPGLCTSCKENLRNVWCQFACNPSNSEFVEPVEVNLRAGDDTHAEHMFPSLSIVNYYVGQDWVRDIYDYCLEDSSFSLLCNPNQDCTDGLGLLSFMGQYKFNTIGSPLKTNFYTMASFDEKEQEDMFCACDKKNSSGCISPMNDHLKSCVGVCGSLCAVSSDEGRTYSEACFGAKLTTGGDTDVSEGVPEKWQDLNDYLEANLTHTDFSVLNYVLATVGGVLGLLLIVIFVFAAIRRRKHSNETPADHAHVDANSPYGQRMSYMDDLMTRSMQSWAAMISRGRNPMYTILVMLTIIVVFTLGVIRLEVETDPVMLWVAESSLPYREMDRYGELFRPFYRSEQVIFVPKDGGIIGREEYIKEAIRLQNIFSDDVVGNNDGTEVKLQDICWKATGSACTINSITQYFQNSMEHFEFYAKHDLAMEHFSTCIYSPENTDVNTCSKLQNSLKSGEKIPETMSDCPCLSAFGAPMNIYNSYLGGFPEAAEHNTTKYLDAHAFVVSILVYNYYDESENVPAIAWEREYIDRMNEENAKNELFHIYVMAEISIQDEIAAESTGDVLPIALSYLLMMIYISIGINRWVLNKTFFQTSKTTVGFLGVVCIIFTVSSTIGIFTWFGVKLQLVIMEVVPFLTLAIGVDNIFLIVHAVSHRQEQLHAQEPEIFVGLAESDAAINEVASLFVSEGIGYIGPSIFMASTAESIAFVFGCINPMPAVLWFAAFAAVAVVFNFMIQMTLFLAIVTLDKRRELKKKYDFVCCISSSKAAPIRKADGPSKGTHDRPLMHVEDNSTPTTPQRESTGPLEESVDPVSHVFDKVLDAYASILSNTLVKLLVLLIFVAWTLVSIYSLEFLQRGLPQKEALPSDSYMISYFEALDNYLATGAPVYYIVEAGYGNNPEKWDLNDQSVTAQFCNSKNFCDEFSIPKILDALSNDLDSDMTHMSSGRFYSWMDDYWGFVNPDSECCRVDKKDKSYLPIVSDDPKYMDSRTDNPTCLATGYSAPPVPAESYMSLFRMFSTAPAGSLCSYGGGSIYQGQFSVDDSPIPISENAGNATLNGSGYGKEITAFSYRVLQTANPTQQDFIDGYAQARRAAEWVSDKTGIDIWVYSLTYVYFDQYLTVVSDTYMLVGLAITAIFVVLTIFFGGIGYPLVVSLVTINIVVQVGGLMHPNDILLNGLSMVNLVIASGISVEFCGHYARMFAKSVGTGDERAKEALKKVFLSVFFGITVTKIIGLSVLTLADSRIFQKYYFRMYMCVVLCGFLNGMVLLPVVLSCLTDLRGFFARKRGHTHTNGQAQDVNTPATGAVGSSPAYAGDVRSPAVKEGKTLTSSGSK